MDNHKTAMPIEELLDYINDAALSEETQATPALQRIFNQYYRLRDKDLDRAFNVLFQGLRGYQFDNAFKTPEFVWRIVQELSRPSPVDDTTRLGSLLNWFGQ